jgi:hypothetical protein
MVGGPIGGRKAWGKVSAPVTLPYRSLISDIRFLM